MTKRIISSASMAAINGAIKSVFGETRNMEGAQAFWVRQLKEGRKRCACCKGQIIPDDYYIDSVLGAFDSLECFVEYATENRDNVDSLFLDSASVDPKKIARADRRKAAAYKAVSIAEWVKDESKFLVG